MANERALDAKYETLRELVANGHASSRDLFELACKNRLGVAYFSDDLVERMSAHAPLAPAPSPDRASTMISRSRRDTCPPPPHLASARHQEAKRNLCGRAVAACAQACRLWVEAWPIPRAVPRSAGGDDPRVCSLSNARVHGPRQQRLRRLLPALLQVRAGPPTLPPGGRPLARRVD